MAVAHYLEALDWQREFIKIHAILGGKNPHLQTSWSAAWRRRSIPTARRRSTPARSSSSSGLITKARDFVTQVYIPDLLAIASFYKDWAAHGARRRQLPGVRGVSRGDAGNPSLFIPQGSSAAGTSRRSSRSIRQGHGVHLALLVQVPGGAVSLHPFDGETAPNYTGPKPPYERLDTDKKYSWLKSPRYDGEPMEVGPLARMLVAYASGHARVKELVGTVLKTLSVGPEALSPRSGASRRAASRRRCSPRRWTTGSMVSRRTWRPASCASTTTRSGSPRSGRLTRSGSGLHEAPRGALATGSTSTTAHRQLSVRRPEHVERRPARRERPPRSVRRSADWRHRSPIPSGRSKSCGPSTRSIPAWRAVSTSSTPRVAKLARVKAV